MVDLTSQWKAAVKKARGGKSAAEDLMKPVTHLRDGFSITAKGIMDNIVTMREFLNEHKVDYLNLSRLSRRKGGGMSEQARRELEEETSLFIDECVSRIQALHKLLSASDQGHSIEGDGGSKWVLDGSNKHLRDHRAGVLSFLHHKLTEVTTNFENMRRVHRAHTHSDKNMERTIAPSRSHYTASASRADLVYIPTMKKAEGDSNAPLTEEQQLQLENEALMKELECTMDQVRETESRVAEIAHLGRLLGNEIASQAHDIDTLYDQAVESSENIKKGNEELTKATKQGVTFRVWVLFFLALASLSLLFLHWYID